ncbi:hypothetical protein ACWC0A_28610 [Streptomyces scopuliridis]
MRPTLAAAQLRGRLTQYLTTTCALTGEDTRRVLERCLEHAETGMLRGPFLRIRTPFHKAEAGGEKHLEWVTGFAPYRHQAKAYERLSTLHGPPCRRWSRRARVPGRPSRSSSRRSTSAAP